MKTTNRKKKMLMNHIKRILISMRHTITTTDHNLITDKYKHSL